MRPTMQVTERDAGDVQYLRRLIQRERNARLRDCYRMALLAIEGREKLEIASILGVANSTSESCAGDV